MENTKKSVQIYNEYLEASSFKERERLYDEVAKACQHERVTARVKKLSMGNKGLEFFVLPLLLVFSFFFLPE